MSPAPTHWMRSGTLRIASWVALCCGLLGLLIPRGDVPDRTGGIACGYYLNPLTNRVYTLYAQLSVHQQRFLGTAVGINIHVVFTELRQPSNNPEAGTRDAAVDIARHELVKIAGECGEEHGAALFDAAIASVDGTATVVDRRRYPLAAVRFLAPFLVAAGALGLAVYVYTVKRPEKKAGACRKCGYDMQRLGRSRACPECGTAPLRKTSG